MGSRSRYGLPICDEEVESTGISEWCKNVKRAIHRFSLNKLNTVVKQVVSLTCFLLIVI